MLSVLTLPCLVAMQVEIKPDMVGTYLAEYSISYKPVKHGACGHCSGSGIRKLRKEFALPHASHERLMYNVASNCVSIRRLVSPAISPNMLRCLQS